MSRTILMFKAIKQADLLAAGKKGGKPAEKAPAKPKAAEPVDLSHPNFVGLLALVKQHGGGGEFGPHNVEPEDEISFTAGEFNGKGRVTAAGEHGATVEDSTAREHRVHWHEVTGHAPAKKKEQKPAK